MNPQRLPLVLAAVFCASCFTAPEERSDVSAFDVGSAGGTFTTPRGLSLVVPPGALTEDVTLTVQPAKVESSFDEVGPGWLLGPEGQRFLVPVELALPVTRGGVTSFAVATAPKDSSSFELLEAQSGGEGLVRASTTHFSVFVPIQTQTNDAGTSAADAGIVDAGDPEPVVVDAGLPPLLIWPDGGTHACLSERTKTGPCGKLRVWMDSDYILGFGAGTFGAMRACSDALENVICNGTTCQCRLYEQPFAEFSAPLRPSSEQGAVELFSCHCGFGAAENVPAACVPWLSDAGSPDDAGVTPAYSLPVGAACTQQNSCSCEYGGGIAYMSTTPACTAPCPDLMCPCGLRCMTSQAQGSYSLGSYYCVPP